jgi:F0F1-type ATP synthase assembly protein I
LSFLPEGATSLVPKSDPPGRVARSWKLLRFSSLGIEMAVATFIGWGIGYWLDLQLGTEPWLMLVFLLLGVAAGFMGVLRAAKEAQEIIRSADTPETSAPPAESNERKAGEDQI